LVAAFLVAKLHPPVQPLLGIPDVFGLDVLPRTWSLGTGYDSFTAVGQRLPGQPAGTGDKPRLELPAGEDTRDGEQGAPAGTPRPCSQPGRKDGSTEVLVPQPLQVAVEQEEDRTEVGSTS